MEPRSIERGETCPTSPGDTAARHASMEPRSIERGEQAGLAELLDRYRLQWSHVQSNVERSTQMGVSEKIVGFNGATFNRTWRARWWPHPTLTSSGFNGATFNRTWRGVMGRRVELAPSALQWSHVQSNVESIVEEHHVRLHLRSFNGATFNRTWREARLEPGFPDGLKLQWSHVQSNVERGSWRSATCASTGLQWSHVQSNVERMILQFRTERGIWASMEPRSIERGEICGTGHCCPTTSTGFNGATFNRTWRGRQVDLERLSEQGFNGATFNRTWRDEARRAIFP